MTTYRFNVILADGSVSRRQQKAPTRSEARGWLKKRLAKDGVGYERILSIKAA